MYYLDKCIGLVAWSHKRGLDGLKIKGYGSLIP